MKKIKVMALALAAVMCAGIFSGCGSEVAENTEVTTVSIWHPNTHTKKYFEEKVAEYNETTGKEKGIKIQYECKTDLNKQMELALANDTAPDIVMELNAAGVQKAAELGQIVALDDIEGGQEIIDTYKDYIAPNGFDDKTYRVPYNVNTRALIYNKDMFKAAGLVDENGEPTPPTTYAEVAEYAKKLTNPSKLPIIKPIVATVALLSFQASWNDYLMPSIFTMTKPSQQTLIVGIMALKNSDGAATNCDLMLAGSAIAIVPVLIAYIFANKHFIAGIAAGAVKG